MTHNLLIERYNLYLINYCINVCKKVMKERVLSTSGQILTYGQILIGCFLYYIEIKIKPKFQFTKIVIKLYKLIN